MYLHLGYQIKFLSISFLNTISIKVVYRYNNNLRASWSFYKI